MRYTVFLRDVSPQNLSMRTLAAAVQAAGGSDVRTLLSSGNAVFDARARVRVVLERSIENSLEAMAGRTFKAFVRSETELDRVTSRSYYPHPVGTKRVIVFCRGAAPVAAAIPFERVSWGLVSASEMEAHGFYAPGPQASALMSYLKRLYGDEFTMRTDQTVLKCSVA